MNTDNSNTMNIQRTFRASLKEELHEGVAKVIFIKADGSKREMRCTLRPDLLPEFKASDHPHTVNEDVLPVFDLDKNDWRSFRLNSVILIEFETE